MDFYCPPSYHVSHDESSGRHPRRYRITRRRRSSRKRSGGKFKQAEGDEVEVIFDGAGTEWVPELEDEDHDYHELYQSVRDDTAVCDFCAGAFGVEDAVDDADVVTLDEHEGHPSIRSLVGDNYEIITY